MKEKKEFIVPICEIINLTNDDIITGSGVIGEFDGEDVGEN